MTDKIQNLSESQKNALRSIPTIYVISFVALALAILPILNIFKVTVMKTDQHVNSTFNPMLLPVSFMLPYKDFQNQTKKSTNLHAKKSPGSKRHKLYGQSKSKIRKILLTVVDGIFHSSSNSLHLGLLFGGLLLLGSEIQSYRSFYLPIRLCQFIVPEICFRSICVSLEALSPQKSSENYSLLPLR